jgi:hypothetical protein
MYRMPLQHLSAALLLVAALLLPVHCDEQQYVSLGMRLESIQATQPHVTVVMSHINTPTPTDPRHDSEVMSAISRQVDSAFRREDADVLEDMLRHTPAYEPSLPAAVVAVRHASDVTLQFHVALFIGEVTDRQSCLREVLSHTASSAFCASALPAHAYTTSCLPLSQAAADRHLGAVISQVDCSLRQ